MDHLKLGRQCQDYIALMEQGTGMIERGDVEALESLTRTSSHLLADMRGAWNELEREALGRGMVHQAQVEELVGLMRDALRHAEDNQACVAAWKARTQKLLYAVKAGDMANAGYAEWADLSKNFVSARV